MRALLGTLFLRPIDSGKSVASGSSAVVTALCTAGCSVGRVYPYHFPNHAQGYLAHKNTSLRRTLQ